MSLKIIVDSACDISKEQMEKWDVEVMPLRIRFGEQEYLDGVTITKEEFFQKLEGAEVLPQTSQLTPYEYEQAFQQVKEAGDTAVCITLSSKLSGCYQSAMLAVSDYEDCVRVVDSKNACLGELILVERAVRLRQEGNDMDEIADILDKEKENIRLVALLDTLEYLKKGGRISSTTAFVGTMLSIKPIVSVQEGEVKLLGKARGLKNGSHMLTELVEKEGVIDFDMPYSLAYSGPSDQLLRRYMKEYEDLYLGHATAEEIPVCKVGSVIGTHIGPGALAVAFFVK